MTLTERIYLCKRVIDQYEAELIGLQQAKIGRPLTRDDFKNENQWVGYQRGWAEGREILQKGEGVGV
jgi:hypothetical protein